MKRWIWSELESYEHEHGEHDLPVAREYSNGVWLAPMHFGNYALVQVETDLHHLEAAKQDHRVIVLSSVQSADRIPSAMANHLLDWGVSPDMTLHEVLSVLGEREPLFLPDH